MAIGKPLHLRLFLEGIEVPVIAATVTAGTNAPASASIQIIPLDSAMDFKPRTMAHLFFLDAKATKGEKGTRVFSKTEGVYRLLFSGETHGFQFVQTPMSRAVVLQCLDFSSYWDAAHATAVEYGPFGNAFTHEGSLSGGNTGNFDDIINNQATVISGWLRSRPRTPGLQGVDGVAGGIIHMMEAMAGYSSNGQHTKGINDFFTISELRCRLLQQMTAEEGDNTAANLMSGRVLMEWLKNSLSNVGQNVTFRDMLLLLMQYIYYENVPNPAPYWTEYQGGKVPEAQRLRTQIIRPDCWFTVPPSCNIIFPEHFTSISYDRVWTKEVTRVLIHTFNALIGRDPIVNDTRILAPSYKDGGGTIVSTVANNQSYRKLMEHELHTGIIPREESLPDTHSVSPDGADGDLQGARTGWAQNISLFHFFKYRFAPRQVQVSGRFNPYVVCGFPGVVMRAPYMPPPEKLAGIDTDEALYQFINQNAEELGAPYHFIGLVNGLTHQIDQNGGTTTVSMHSVRRHAGTDDEFLRIVKDSKEKTKPLIVKVTLTSKMAATSDDAFNMLRDMTPQKPEPRMSSVVDEAVVTREYERTSKNADGSVSTRKGTTKGKRKTVKKGGALPFTNRGDIPEAKVYNVLTPSADGQKIMVGAKTGFFTNSEIVGIEVKADPSDTTAIEVVERNGESVNLYKALVVYQKVEIPQPVEVPLETVLKPVWFSNAYNPRNVGKRIYQEFFGCDSIIDSMSISSAEQTVNLRTGNGVTPDASPGVLAVSGDAMVGDSFVESIAGKLNNPEDMTVERALNILAFVYGRVKSSGQDVDDFIQQVIYRPIATKDQILGEEGIDVTMGKDGKPVASGKLGFHTLALHPNMINHKEKLAGLLYDPELKMQRASGHGSKAPIEPKYDVRKEKWDRVKSYADALVGKRGRQGLLG